ncbi:MAG TPA: hypothetical protein EYQ69_09445 [Gemmatimonadetes bacterium]|nr:hypothetical protein [Gemmatimonadota bacterium]
MRVFNPGGAGKRSSDPRKGFIQNYVQGLGTVWNHVPHHWSSYGILGAMIYLHSDLHIGRHCDARITALAG